MESQSSIPSTRRREEMTDVEENAKLCNGNQICRGSFERGEIHVFARDFSGAPGDFHLS